MKAKTGKMVNQNATAKVNPESYKSGGTVVKKGSPENKAGRGLMGSAKKGGYMKKGGAKKK